MSDTLTYQRMGTAARGQAHALFAQTMGYVAATTALFALGAWLGRNLTGGIGIVAFIAAFACLIGMRFAARSSVQLTVGLLAAFGLLIGLAVAPTIAYYASMDPRALWQAGGATALFIAGFGAAGYATRRDLSAIARVSFWALLALIVFGIVLIFVNIPHGDLVYSILGLVIFAGFVMFDFQRLRTNQDITVAPFLAASIFLDVLNVFLFFLEIFSGSQERLRARHALRAGGAHEGRRVPAGVHRDLLHVQSGLRGVDHVPVPDVDGDVTDAVVIEQVAGLDG
jgi:FtsH-binding integral membrane protein